MLNFLEKGLSTITALALVLSSFGTMFLLPQVAMAANENVSQLSFTEAPAGSLEINEKGYFIVQAQDASGNSTTTDDSLSITLSDGSNGGIFYDGTTGGACTDALSGVEITVASGTSNKAFCYSNATAGSYTVTASAGTAEVTATVEVESSAVEAALTNVDAYYAAGTGYTGIGVDFTVENVSTVTDVELIARGGSTEDSIHGTSVIFEAINTGAVSGPYTTSGTVIITGSRTSSSGSWETMNGTWSGTDRPTEVEVIITLEDGTELNLTDSTIVENGGNTEETVFADVPATDEGGSSGGDDSSDGEITSVDAYYSVGSGYTAISVDFTTEDITDATKVELRVNRDDSSTYSITAQQSVIDAINATSPKTTTGPIVITGSRTSGSWNDQTGTWSGSALPESVDVIITLADSTELTLRDTTISETKATQAAVLPTTPEPLECTYDFQAQKMWEVTWGYGFADRNGGAPVFTPDSYGGLVTINGNPTDWNDYHLYISDNGNYNPRHNEYGFADGTVWTVDYTWVESDGCHTPDIVWNHIPAVDPTDSHALNLSGTVYRDVALDDCDSKGECENRTNEKLSGWEMRLYKENQADSTSWELVKTSTTNEEGVYNFGAQKAAGTYHVCAVMNDGWSQPIQNWSGSGYLVNTDNLSGDSSEGPYCTTTNYDDISDRSSKSNIGMVDTQKPAGVITYTGGTDIDGVRHLSSIDDFTFAAELTDNHLLDRTTYVVWKVDSNFKNREGFCGNWHSNASTNIDLNGAADTVTANVKDCTTAAWDDGNYEISHRVYDVAGNYVGLTQPTQKFILDSSAPVVSNVILNGEAVSVARVENCGLTDFNLVGGTVNLSATIEDASEISKAQYKIRKVTNGGCTQANIYNSAQVNMKNDGGDSWVTLSGSELDTKDTPSDGTYTIQMTVTDSLGNVGTHYIDILVDNTAPTTPSITKPTPRQWFKSKPIKTTWTSASDINGIDHYQVGYLYDDGHTFGNSTCEDEEIGGVALSGCRDVAGTQRDHNPSSSEEGGVTLWVRAVDTAGNAGPWSKSVHYYYDHTVPVTDIVAPTGTVGSSFTVSGDASDNIDLNRVYVQLVNRDNNKRYGGTTISLIGKGTDAHWSKSYDATALSLPDGDYAAHVSVVDRAGNTSSAGWTENFTVDSTEDISESDVEDDGTEEGDEEEEEENTHQNDNRRNTSTRVDNNSNNYQGMVLGISTSLEQQMRDAMLQQLMQILMQTSALYGSLNEDQQAANKDIVTALLNSILSTLNSFSESN